MPEVTHTDILVALARLEGKIDTIAAGVEGKIVPLVARAHDHEKRLRGLERFRNWGAGLAASVPLIGWVLTKTDLPKIF